MSAGALPRGARLRGFHGIGLRSLRARPLRSVLTAGGIVLGVGMAFGVLILVTTIHSSFENLFDAVYGRTSVIVSGSNSIGSVPESELPKIRRVEGVKAAEGDVFGVFRTVSEEGTAENGRDSMLFVAGVNMDGYDTAGSEVIAGREPRGRREIELEESWASQQGYEPGDRLRLATPTGRADVTVTGIYKLETNLDLGGYGTAAMPIDGQRELTNKYGTFDEINVVAEEGTSAEELKRRIAAVTGPGVEAETPAGKGEEANESLSGLDIVLYFFSGIALFVGAFLILNSFNMTVLQRMREIGTLRALGASRRRLAAGGRLRGADPRRRRRRARAGARARAGRTAGLGDAELLRPADLGPQGDPRRGGGGDRGRAAGDARRRPRTRPCGPAAIPPIQALTGGGRSSGRRVCDAPSPASPSSSPAWRSAASSGSATSPAAPSRRSSASAPRSSCSSAWCCSRRSW